MKKILLIDDMAHEGWKSVLEKTVVKTTGEILTAITQDEAEIKLKEEFDLIFLDVRLIELDHFKLSVQDMSGFKILKKIKKKFTNPNFSTPVILITATNKIWNIEAFRQYGIDGYYIKEHPDHSFSKDISRENLENIQNKYQFLLSEGKKRKSIWNSSIEFINTLNNLNYFNDSSNKNIKTRISDKLKLGYAYLFKDVTELERTTLNVDNESMAFIIYFSILEELVKGFSKNTNWDRTTHIFTGNWKFRNNREFILYEPDMDKITVHPYWDHKKNRMTLKELNSTDKKADNYLEGKLNLSEQVYALLFLYDGNQKKDLFKRINNHRNRVDYIHSSVANIYRESLIDSDRKNRSFNKIEECLTLLNFIINLPK
jgi:CheY-like chemotaxis protein